MKQEMQNEKTKMFYLASALLLMLIFIYLPLSKNLENLLFEGKLFLCRVMNTYSGKDFNRIAIVEIDKDSVEKYPDPLSTGNVLKFLRKAEKYGAEGVVFLSPVETNGKKKNTDRLLKYIEKGIPVFGTYFFSRDMNGSDELNIRTPSPSFLNRTRERGFVMPVTDSDGIMRRAKLGISWRGRYLPSIEIALLAFLRNASTKNIGFGDGCIYLETLRIPTDRDYNSIFLPDDENSFDTYSFQDIMTSKNLRDLKGKIVLVGRVDGDNNKKFSIPLPGNPRKTLLYTTASNISALAKGQFITNLPPLMNMTLLLLMGALAGLILPLLNQKRLYLASVLTVILSLIMVVLLFNRGINMEIAPLILSLPFFVSMVTFYRYYHTQSQVCKFVPDPLIRVLQDGNPDNDFQTVVRKCSVLFCDIKGYTTLSERYNPADVMYMLEEYITVMNQVVTKNHGYIINYQGDGLLAVFGLEDDGEYRKHAVDAVKCAILMQDAVNELRRKWHVECRELFVIGIGIATGEVAIGSLGTDSFRQYTVIGNTVNVAARLMATGKFKRIPVVVNEDTHELVRGRFRMNLIEGTRIRGKYKECKIYEVEDYRHGKVMTNPGISLEDSRETAMKKKIEYYKRIRAIMEV